MEQYFVKGIIKKIVDKGVVSLSFLDLRTFATDKHRRVDDYPFGKKQGMLLKVDVLDRALASIENIDQKRLIYLCPSGDIFDQKMAEQFSLECRDIVFIIGYYEGVDDRIFNLYDIQRVSMGNFVLSSGELAAMTVADSVIRLLPGALGNQLSAKEDSISMGLIEYPQYTHPRSYQNLDVPDVVVSGDHEKLRQWRLKESLQRTLERRPLLLQHYNGDMLTDVVKDRINSCKE